MKKFDLEERLIVFSVTIGGLTKQITKNYTRILLVEQLLRSGISLALNYGKTQSAESRKDYIHKIKIGLKKLRETFVGLKIINKTKLYKSHYKLDIVIKENNELISIFV